MRHTRILSLTALATVSIAASVATAKPANGGKVVQIHDIAYHPTRLVVHRGETVNWRFLDPATQHTVTSRGAQRFRSSGFRSTGTYTVRFTTPGTYHYYCRVHPFMHATVVVVK